VSGLDLEWRDSYTIGGGFEYKLTPAWMLRAGYMFSKSPLRDRTFTPSIPTNDRHLFSIGTGYTFGKNTIDLAYSFVPMETRQVRTAATPAFNGDYEIEWHVFSLSYTRRF
jgi:long-chain fatty acid transport protein